MSTFKREERYIVVKISDLRAHHALSENKGLGYSGALAADEKPALQKIIEGFAQRVREELGKPQIECVVVESDWPEYEPTWAAIQARMSGKQPDTIQVSRAEYEALQKAAGQYYRVMDLLRDSMHMKHGLCEPRERRACTRCNATDDLATMVSEYRGAPLRAAINVPGNGEGGEG